MILLAIGRLTAGLLCGHGRGYQALHHLWSYMEGSLSSIMSLIDRNEKLQRMDVDSP